MKKIFIIFLFLFLATACGKQTSPYAQSINLISPSGGESLTEGSVYTIKWQTQNIPENYKISVIIRRIPPPPLPQEGQEFDPVVFTGLPNTGSHNWKISDIYPEGSYILGITSYSSVPVSNPISDESRAAFKIIKNPQASWRTYSNSKLGYSINYPPNWSVREFPTLTGAGFRPSNTPADIASECVAVDARATAASEYKTPFATYVKKAAIVEIQGYEKLNSLEPVSTSSGLTGYETTWIYRSAQGREQTSLPITYFDNPKATQSINYKTVQIILDNQDCQAIYAKMLETFKLLK